MFDKTIDDPVVKDIFIASPGCIHKFTKRHQLSCIKKKKKWNRTFSANISMFKANKIVK